MRTVNATIGLPRYWRLSRLEQQAARVLQIYRELTVAISRQRMATSTWQSMQLIQIRCCSHFCQASKQTFSADPPILPHGDGARVARLRESTVGNEYLQKRPVPEAINVAR